MMNHRARILQKLESWRDELKKHDNIKQVLPATPAPRPTKRGNQRSEHRKGTMGSQAVHVEKTQGWSRK